MDDSPPWNFPTAVRRGETIAARRMGMTFLFFSGKQLTPNRRARQAASSKPIAAGICGFSGLALGKVAAAVFRLRLSDRGHDLKQLRDTAFHTLALPEAAGKLTLGGWACLREPVWRARRRPARPALGKVGLVVATSVNRF
jgi:hypothetical protein